MAVDETKLCVNSILNNVNGEKKIIVVDNASPNKTFNDLQKEYKDTSDVVVIESKENLGFAKGNNLGYKYAVEYFNPEFIVVMNNDMEIKQQDFIEEIDKSFSEYNYYIMGPDIYSTKKKYHQNPQTRKVPNKEELKKLYRKFWIKDKLRFVIALKWKLNELRGKTEEDDDRSNVEYVEEVRVNPLLHGSCYVFSKLFIEKYKDKCFYDKTFMYMEAEILYYQALRNNEKMIYYPNLKIEHHEDVSTDATFKKQYKKSIFSVKCLLQSYKAFLELIELNEHNEK